jgi:hypothetical protein
MQTRSVLRLVILARRSARFYVDDGCPLTTVIVSTQTVNTSDVRYRESESEYSFHSCAYSDWSPATLLPWYR